MTTAGIESTTRYHLVHGGRRAPSDDRRGKLEPALLAGGIGLWELDLRLDELRLYGAARELLGLPEDSEVSLDRLRERLEPAQRAVFDAALTSALAAEGSGHFECELRIETPDEPARWIAWHGQAEFTEQGKTRLPLRVVGTLSDVTDRRRMQDSLRRTEAAAREADRRKDEFLSLLAHELRNPLAPLSSGLQIMRRPGASSAMVDAARNMMERQLAQLTGLIDDLLDVSRIARNKLELHTERVDLAQIVAAAVEKSLPLIAQGGHDFTQQMPAEPVIVEADPQRLAQAISKLLDNSAKFTPPGGSIRLTVERQRGEVAIRVSDTGVGFSENALPGVFDPYALPDRCPDHGGGLGLGLPLVRGIVEMHGGSVSAYSDGPGRGSTFVVHLPLRASGSPATVPPREKAVSAEAGVRHSILAVDDNRDSAASLAMMLELLGHEARATHDGERAIELAAELQPDLIFLDIGMPRVNGFEVARRIREQPWGRDVRIVMLTGYGQEEDRRLSREAGADDYLVKPVDPVELERILTQPGARHH